jgi:hypothetical protein
MARVTAISRATGRVIRRATARPVTRATRAARPAAPAIRWARSRIGDRSADAQLLFLSQAAPAATAIALVSSVRCCLAKAETSAAANAAVSPASSATAARATARKASASLSPSASPRAARRTGPALSLIAGQAEPVPATQHGLHDLRI